MKRRLGTTIRTAKNPVLENWNSGDWIMTLSTRDRNPPLRATGMRRTARILFAVLAPFILPATSYAHHPGENLDTLLGSKEKYFQAIDRAAPDFLLRDADGQAVKLADFRDRIVVLNFVYARCPDVCPLHAEKIAEVQGMINATPMRNLVQFITVTTDPRSDTPDVLKTYGPTHGLDSANWMFLTIGPDQREDATRKLAEAYGHKFVKTKDGYQTHGVVTHIIDRGGRWAANFHGLRFAAINMVLYVNGLTNETGNSRTPDEGTFWDRVRRFFR
jgi:protein SCO1/2